MVNMPRSDVDWKELAQKLCNDISPKFLQEQLHAFAGKQPHQTGTATNRLLGERIASEWKSWNIPIVRTEEFFVTLPLGPSPAGPFNEVVLIDAASAEVIFEAQNYVTVPPGQKTSDRSSSHFQQSSTETHPVNSEGRSIIPVYHAYSTNGSVEGRFVFVNYARPHDLVAFDRAQNRQKGQPSLLCSANLVAIARLQTTGRQSKVRALMSHCACGPDGSPVAGHHPSALLLYPDPQDTVAPDCPIYPDGPGLPGDAPVFGHLCMSLIGGGNPGAPHLPSSIHTYETDELVPGRALTPIPVQPISYNNAAVILSHLSGPKIPEEWSGCLATNIGPSDDSILKVTVNNSVSQQRILCLNVLGVIPGSRETDESDQYVIFGNHRDAWVQGACDPGSGTIILQHLAKLLGSAYKEGFRPRRTIVLASWDGEELSLLGSTHEVEQRHLELKQRAVAYLNADCPVKGHNTFVARSDLLLTDALLTSAQLVQVDPPVDSTAWLQEWLKQEGKPPNNEPSISPPGTGSDHIPFCYKLGVPSSYPGFLPDDGLFYPPVYHTAYDIITVAEQFTDPVVSDTGPLPRHRLLVRLYLTMILQLACASRLPYSISRWAKAISNEWATFAKFAISKVPNLTSFGVYLGWISEDLEKLVLSANRLEAFLDNLDEHLISFPAVLNRTVANVPKCFVKPSPSDPDGFPFVLYTPRGYDTVYFHRVQSAFTHFRKHLKRCNSGDQELHYLRLLKQELSILAACISQANECMNNGLAGLEEFS